jgi:hypothetical protein
MRIEKRTQSPGPTVCQFITDVAKGVALSETALTVSTIAGGYIISQMASTTSSGIFIGMLGAVGMGVFLVVPVGIAGAVAGATYSCFCRR